MAAKKLWDTLRGRQQLPVGAGAEEPEELTCAVCGAPAVTWNYESFPGPDGQVVEGQAVCAAHVRSRERKAAG
jgi:hypothetical protein